ncbi:MAG: peptidoglycan-binding protein [Firmicutes bacterium]|nr:peptidoglycan-binding protein [Bacillota bacterium]
MPDYGADLPVVPAYITVHLGAPDDAEAQNVQVSFTDYIKNVASNEIYPTWPESALIANILAQISLALNRVYLEWYPSQGYDFDITNTTQYDQVFVYGSNIYENISQIVDEIFDQYLVKGEAIEPFFAQFCNGTTSTCDGLQQWGTVSLAEQGYTPIEILRYYYGDDIQIVNDAPIDEVLESYPGIPLRRGFIDNAVKSLQVRLNAIRSNYPAIPEIPQVNGVFDAETEEAVLAFQKAFDLPQTGEVDKSTWYRVVYVYNAVLRLGELTSLGIFYKDVERVTPVQLMEGDWGTPVTVVQYYLDVLGYFNQNIPLIDIDGYFGPDTLSAVKAFQRSYDLPIDGTVDRMDWVVMFTLYQDLINNLPPGYSGKKAEAYPGYAITLRAEGEAVDKLQSYLQLIAAYREDLPPFEATGVFDQQTLALINALRREWGIDEVDYVGHLTWYRIGQLYDSYVEAVEDWEEIEDLEDYQPYE